MNTLVLSVILEAPPISMEGELAARGVLLAVTAICFWLLPKALRQIAETAKLLVRLACFLVVTGLCLVAFVTLIAQALMGGGQ